VSLKYLELSYGTSIRATRSFIIKALKEKLRKSYGLLSRVKVNSIRKHLVVFITSFFAPNVFFLVHIWKFFTASERKQIRSLFFRFCKNLLRIPIWTRNRYISRHYSLRNLRENG
jgi:hypothetical protein